MRLKNRKRPIPTYTFEKSRHKLNAGIQSRMPSSIHPARNSVKKIISGDWVFSKLNRTKPSILLAYSISTVTAQTETMKQGVKKNGESGSENNLLTV